MAMLVITRWYMKDEMPPWIELRQAPGFWLGKSWGAVVEAAGRLEVS